MARLLGLTLGLLMVVGTLGCAGGQRMPDIFHPGTTSAQQNKSVRFDPYPQPNMGPTMVGARPRDYEKPIPETDRARWQQSVAPYPSAMRP